MEELKCKVCGEPYEPNQAFCYRCKNALPIEDEPLPELEKEVTCPFCHRSVSEQYTECPYCGEKLSLERLVEAAVWNNRYRNLTQFGIVLGAGSFLAIFFSPIIALIMAIVGLLLSILGISLENKIALYGTITSSIGLLVIITLLVLVVGFNFQTSFLAWSIKEEVEEPILNGNREYKESVYTSWEENDGKNLVVLKNDGTFAWHYDKVDLEQNYQTGIFQLENGINTSQGIVYEDQSFYYYQLTLFKLASNQNGVTENDNISASIYTLGIKKDTRDGMCLENLEDEKNICFHKIQEAPVG